MENCDFPLDDKDWVRVQEAMMEIKVKNALILFYKSYLFKTYWFKGTISSF